MPPKNIKLRALGFFSATLIGILSIACTVHAEQTINLVTLDGNTYSSVNPYYVFPGQTITVVVSGTLTKSSKWLSSAADFDTGAIPANGPAWNTLPSQCFDITSPAGGYTNPGIYTQSFTYTVQPTPTGTLNAFFGIFNNLSCGGTNATVTWANAIVVRTTTLATGTDPAAATIAPGAAVTDVDAFTLQTNSGTEAITSVTVNLSTSSGVGRLSITDSAGTELGFTTSPVMGSNAITVTGMSATTTLTTFKVRVTPLSHAAMPAPPGAAYFITAPVTAWAGPNAHTGSDTNPNALTIDNLSPAGATATSGTAGNAQTTLNWTTSVSTDFSRSVMLRWTGGSAGTDVPAEGTDYAVGNAIGTATVVCVRTADAASTAVSGVDGGGTGGCSATALTNGQAYTYKIFQKDSNSNYDVGVAIGSFTPAAPAVASFNAFETTTTAGAITGVIKTKIAGSAFSLDVVAISGGAQASTFTNTVKVELLGNTTTGISLDGNNCPTSFTLLQTVSPNPTITSGRSTVNFAAVSDAWKDVRVRISFPTTSPTVTSCSTDNFAIRPNSLSVSVTDADWLTAGTTRTLNNSGATGGNVHKAGQPFTISATAYNAAAAITGNYAGSPVVQTIACTLPTPTCTNGTLTPGAWAAAGGTVTSATATYSEAGSFNLTLQDTTFASVDAADGTPATCAGYYVCSAAVSVGRFVPDHFIVTTNNVPKFKTFNNAACAVRSFTYIGQPFGYVTAPQVLVTAQNASNATTTNYGNNLWQLATAAGAQDCTTNPGICTLTSGSVTQTYTYTTTPAATPNWDSAQIALTTPTIAANNNGTGTVTANSGDLLAFSRSATTPLAPFTTDISLSMSVADSSESGVTGNGVIGTGTPALFSNIAFDSGNAFRYGRLWLANAYGSEKRGLNLPYEMQYWNGNGFVKNTLDSCTALTAANFGIGNLKPSGFNPSGYSSPVTAISVGAFSAGGGLITLAAPNMSGSADVVAKLGASLSMCPGWAPSYPSGTPISASYLRGKWCGSSYDKDPVARATFGISGSSAKKGTIYLRENY